MATIVTVLQQLTENSLYQPEKKQTIDRIYHCELVIDPDQAQARAPPSSRVPEPPIQIKGTLPELHKLKQHFEQKHNWTRLPDHRVVKEEKLYAYSLFGVSGLEGTDADIAEAIAQQVQRSRIKLEEWMLPETMLDPYTSKTVNESPRPEQELLTQHVARIKAHQAYLSSLRREYAKGFANTKVIANLPDGGWKYQNCLLLLDYAIELVMHSPLSQTQLYSRD
jgi:hypothetical protein